MNGFSLSLLKLDAAREPPCWRGGSRRLGGAGAAP